jgi:hypothetical protein
MEISMRTVSAIQTASRSAYTELKSQLHGTRYILPSILMIVFGIFFVIYLVARGTSISVDNLTRDPSVIAGMPFYYGLFTYLSIACWAAAVGICFVGVFLIGNDLHFRQPRLALLYGGTLSLMLMFDDAFMLHEHVLPNVFRIKEYVVYTVYLLAFAGFIYLFWREILKTDFLLLFASAAALGTSIGIDTVFEVSEFVTYSEDGFKSLGISFWVAYFARFTKKAVHRCYTVR